ncbi:carbohydrate ABC transporter permease [uncultured Thermanaerothrix sp.]|uniref:carbohydrate ABC transporter permease n=1 Tax=uncultured Thermanaerothrix sp. TaxID=1195149 RepID=UPI002615F3E7|nr:carbohydrate ABC transporter permease [uncultured Thermanaerothrix sp.]
MKKSQRPLNRSRVLRLLLLYLLAVAGAAVMVFPFLWMVSNAFKEHVFVIEYPPQLIPTHPSVGNFVRAWTSNNFQLYFTNSAIVALTSTFFTVLFSAMMAYAFARFQFPGREALFFTILLVLMVPDMITIIPKFLLIKTLGLRNSLWGLILVYIAGSTSLNTFLLRGFFEQLPHELEEAMLIDGAGYLTIFLRMILPLSAPALATVTIFSFLGHWDEFTWALTIIDDPLKRTLPIAIYSFQGQHGTEWGLVFAAMIIALIPVLIIFIALQRYFVSGITAGAVKG